ncbi:hypothetical protein [Leptothoe spongobia]|uniref:Uncharacterized protein n=1 Tax=Leptothoe spongobia TAU-MAC 1115 TaxID=1967444 RepID=A0A947DF37_9CYAN|nr:hypothetical protein [Leptothoe spongobia]MBT9315600.1 hypothetical protein [Leptothoe spongobia TAU-MAC 1115]
MTHSPLYASQNNPAPTPDGRQPTSYAPKPHPQSSQRPAWILSTIALTALAIVPQDLWSRLPMSLSAQSSQQQSTQQWTFGNKATEETCQSILNAEQRLSRGQLTQFLSIAQTSSQASVHETIAPPYCILSRTNQTQQREVYPLAFDPDTWFVVNYDQKVYQGYDFVFKK